MWQIAVKRQNGDSSVLNTIAVNRMDHRGPLVQFTGFRQSIAGVESRLWYVRREEIRERRHG